MKKILFSLFIGSLVFTSCSTCSRDDDGETVTPAGDAQFVSNLNASSTTQWVYYSFTDNKIVDVTTPETDLTWDIAFNRYNIKTNGGTSGKGQSEVINTFRKDFDAVTQAPTGTYTKDTEVKIPGRPDANGNIPYTTVSLNSVITGQVNDGTNQVTGWWTYTPPAPGSTTPHFEVTKYVYVVKRASDARPVKIQLTSYNNTADGKSTSGYISFQYKVAGSDSKF